MSSSQAAAPQQPPPNNDDADVSAQQMSDGKEKDKDKKRRFFGLGKRKDGDKSPSQQAQGAPPASSSDSPSLAPAAPLDIPRAPRSPPQHHSLSAAASPARSSRLRSSSPRLEPDSSSIFERNVQDNTLPDEIAKDLPIPAHIQTEDHIPPALEASTIAITDDHLGPDEVKIVTHTAHQPAAEKVVGAGGGTHTPGASEAGLSPVGGLSPIEDTGINIHQSLESSQTLPHHPLSSSSLAQSGAFGTLAHSSTNNSNNDDASSSYAAGGGADAADVRRLSFISFADVVHSEHAEHQHAHAHGHQHAHGPGRDSAMHMSVHSLHNRSPSPVLRSPVSSQGLSGSPPTSGAPSMQGLDISGKTGTGQALPLPPGSPGRPGAGGATGQRDGGEIVVETMRQALRRTGSGDLRNAAATSEADLPQR